MISHALDIGFVLFGLALLCTLWRLLRGPDVLDRVLAADTLVINFIALIVLLGIRDGSSVYFEAALFFAMMGFVSTVAFCRFLMRERVIE